VTRNVFQSVLNVILAAPIEKNAVVIATIHMQEKNVLLPTLFANQGRKLADAAATIRMQEKFVSVRVITLRCVGQVKNFVDVYVTLRL